MTLHARGVTGGRFVDCLASANDIVDRDRRRRLRERRLQDAPQPTIGRLRITLALGSALVSSALRSTRRSDRTVVKAESTLRWATFALRSAAFGVKVGARSDSAGLRLGELARPGGGDRRNPAERLANLTAILLPRLEQEGLVAVGADAHGEARKAIVEDELVLFAVRWRRERPNNAIGEMSWHERKTPARTQMRTKRNAA